MAKKKVTKNATKQEILDAYQELLEEVSSSRATPDETKLHQAKNSITTIESDLTDQVNLMTQHLGTVVRDIVRQLSLAHEALETQALVVNSLKEQAEVQQQRLKQEHSRTEEEFAYEFERKKKRLELELTDKETATDRRLKEREETLKEAETELNDLRSLAKTFEARLAKGIQDAVSTKTKELEAEHAHVIKLITQEHTSKEELLRQKAESMEATIKTQQQELDRLAKQVSSLNQQLAQIAQSAVSRNAQSAESRAQA